MLAFVKKYRNGILVVLGLAIVIFTFRDFLLIQYALVTNLSARADPAEVWELAQTFQNPEPWEESFDDDTAWERWNAHINGNGRLYEPPKGPAASVAIENGMLILTTSPDPDFEGKSQAWAHPAPAAYNNGFAVSNAERAMMPTIGEDIVYEGSIRVDHAFLGSTGLFVQERDTFNAQGEALLPFRAIAFSYNPTAAPYLNGMRPLTVVGWSLPCLQDRVDIDATAWHTYRLQWGWKNPHRQQVTFFVDGKHVGSCTVDPFGPGEVQLWADNYDIQSLASPGYRNPDRDYSAYVDWVRAFTIPHE